MDGDLVIGFLIINSRHPDVFGVWLFMFIADGGAAQ
jgi:hypothetical protein